MRAEARHLLHKSQQSRRGVVRGCRGCGWAWKVAGAVVWGALGPASPAARGSRIVGGRRMARS